MRQTEQQQGCGSPRVNLYDEVTDRIVKQLEQGCVPWVQPWQASGGAFALPVNAATSRYYTGINILILWDAASARGFGANRWLTFRQALSLGGNVRKGERGTTACYADSFIPRGGEAEKKSRGSSDFRPNERAEKEEPQRIPFLKRFTLFNVSQCENLPAELLEQPRPVSESEIHADAEALIAATKADIRIGGGEAFYHRIDDYICVPPQTSFFDVINFYRTCCHELSHWTGSKSRLARDLENRFGSSGYAREELVAELSCAFLCAHLNIVPTVRHADYIGNWLTVLRDDSRAIFNAASLASKAADFILAFRAPKASEAELAA
ncbi:MAG TPA: zincin-like metallopeptidase domain-containing protein [Rhizomicrobium sp.]